MRTTHELIKEIQRMLKLARACQDVDLSHFGRPSWGWWSPRFEDGLDPVRTTDQMTLLELTRTIIACGTHITCLKSYIPTAEIRALFPGLRGREDTKSGGSDGQCAHATGGDTGHDARALAAGWKDLTYALPLWKDTGFSTKEVPARDTITPAREEPLDGAGALPGLLIRLDLFIKVLAEDKAVGEALTSLLTEWSDADPDHERPGHPFEACKRPRAG